MVYTSHIYISMTKVQLALAGHLSAIGLVAGVWALVNASANTKYVCGGSSDAYVTTARWLDIGQFITAFATSSLVFIRQAAKDDSKSGPQLAVLAEVCGGLSALIFLTTVITTGSVCSNNKCITSEAAYNAMHGIETEPYHRQVNYMIGITPTANETGTMFPCGGNLDPYWFQSPINYCPTTINTPCLGYGATVVTAERCLVFACSDLVPGGLARYTISTWCLILQTIAAVILAVHERGTGQQSTTPMALPGQAHVGAQRSSSGETPLAGIPVRTAKAQPSGSGATLEAETSSGTSTALRKRSTRKHNSVYYSSVADDIDF